MPETVTVVLGGISVAAISCVIGKFLGGNGRVVENRCKERREACTELISEKIDHLIVSIDNLKKDVDKIVK